MSDKPRVMTEDEVREKFLDHVWSMINWWENETREPSSRAKLEGLAHSFLAMLDGSVGFIPRFSVCPDPRPEDKAFHEEQDENWWPERADVSGSLHEQLFTHGRKRGFIK